MDSTARNGRIVTFYSFKGGVGRTMSLANVAFLAALNGLRVLVMDWDLEAPGLAYYFRSLLDPAQSKTLREKPGVLDILWEWRTSVGESSTSSALDTLQTRYSSGNVFQEGICPLLSAQYLPRGGSLDFIGAGRSVIATPKPQSYEEALTSLSWTRFFEEEAGGYVLYSLRQWAKQNYDLVLIDSRTGLADVAGICTMQIPDTVALCFVLNRQNIDGVARIAAAIRAKRGPDIQLRALPMRVARQDTAEESDARAHAINELVHNGGFTQEAVQKDFLSLSVDTAENVPFYETLAPFSARRRDPELDPLTLNYMSLAKHLIDRLLEMPKFDLSLLNTARQRMAPRHATLDYLKKLEQAEPERALSELQRLVNSAFDAANEGDEQDEDYIVALTEAAFHISDDMGYHVECIELLNRNIELLRILYKSEPSKWHDLFIDVTTRYLMTDNHYEIDDTASLIGEIDTLIALFPNIKNQFKRLTLQRHAMNSIPQTREEAKQEAASKSIAMVRGLRLNKNDLTGAQENILLTTEVDANIAIGNIHEKNSRMGDAISYYNSGLEILSHLEPRTAVDNLAHRRYKLHFHLANGLDKIGQSILAISEAINTLQWAAFSIDFEYKLPELTKIAENNAKQAPQFFYAFCEKFLQHQESDWIKSSSQHRFLTQRLIPLTQGIANLIAVIASLNDQHSKSHIVRLAQLANSYIQIKLISIRNTLLPLQLHSAIATMLPALEQVGLSLEQYPALAEVYYSSAPDHLRPSTSD